MGADLHLDGADARGDPAAQLAVQLRLEYDVKPPLPYTGIASRTCPSSVTSGILQNAAL